MRRVQTKGKGRLSRSNLDAKKGEHQENQNHQRRGTQNIGCTRPLVLSKLGMTAEKNIVQMPEKTSEKERSGGIGARMRIKDPAKKCTISGGGKHEK